MTASIVFLVIIILLIALKIAVNKDKIKLSPERKKIRMKDIDYMLKVFVILFFVMTFFFIGCLIPSSSMYPTLKTGDRIVLNKFVYMFYKPAKHDIIVFKTPESAHSKGKDFIKRIIATEGDSIEVKYGIVFVNDIPQYEYDYIIAPPFYYMPKIKVPPNHVFVLGDNRNNSTDSHIWGFLPKKNIIGKAVMIYFPPQRIRTF